MRKIKYYDLDREKKIHKVVKGNKVVKHKKTIYNYESDEDFEEDLYDDEMELNEVDTSNTH